MQTTDDVSVVIMNYTDWKLKIITGLFNNQWTRLPHYPKS